MKIPWLNKIVRRVAEEVHKSKIDEMDKRMIEMEKDYKAIKLILTQNKDEIKDLQDKLYSSVMTASKMEGAITTMMTLQGNNIKQLKDGHNEE